MATEYYAVTASSSVYFSLDAASCEAIRAALRAVQVPRGQWVGPAPRITRTNPALGVQYTTHVTWIMAIDVVTFAPLRSQQLHDVVAEQLGHVGDWTVDVAPYSSTINGSLDFWTSGQAANTQTSCEFPSAITSSYLPGETAAGPTTPQTRPPAPSEVLPQIGMSIGGILLVGALIAGAVYLAPTLAARRAVRR